VSVGEASPAIGRRSGGGSGGEHGDPEGVVRGTDRTPVLPATYSLQEPAAFARARGVRARPDFTFRASQAWPSRSRHPPVP